MNWNKTSNNALLGTRHKVSGPQNADVVHKMNIRTAIVLLGVVLSFSCSSTRDTNRYDSNRDTQLILQIKDDNEILDQDSTIELISKGNIRLYDRYSQTPLLSPTVNRSPEGYQEISNGAYGCDRFWVVILPKGNKQKERTRHPIYSFNASSLSTMTDWSEWLTPDYEAIDSSHWTILDTGGYTNQLPVDGNWPYIRYRMVIMDVSGGFPGVEVKANMDNTQDAQQGVAPYGAQGAAGER